MDPKSAEENRIFADRFERVCQERIASRAHEVDREGALSQGIIRDLSDAGYFRLFHPKQFGGLDADTAMLCHAMESLGKACPSTFWVSTVSSLLVGKILHKMGNAEQHQRFLLPIIRAERIGAFAAVETGPGGDQRTYQTTISKSGNNYVLNGFKSRVNNAPVADTCVIVARNLPGEGELGDTNLRFVFVDLRQKGVKRFPIPTLGMRASPWGGMFLENVVVTQGDILAGDFETVLDVAEWGQVFVAFMAIGVGEAALEAALEFTGSRSNFGQPAGHMLGVQRMLATIRMEVNAARALAWRAVWAKMHKQEARDLTKMAKVGATEMAVRCADLAMQMHGAWGATKHFAIERLYRDAITTLAAAISNEMLRDLVACYMVGRDPYKHGPCDYLASNGISLERPEATMPGPAPHSRMYADRSSVPFEWGPIDRTVLARVFANGRTSHNIEIPDHSWDSLGNLAQDMGTDRASLINQSIHTLLRTGWPFGGGSHEPK